MGCSDAVVATLATTVESTLAVFWKSQAKTVEVDKPRTAASNSDLVMIILLRNRLGEQKTTRSAVGDKSRFA